MITTAQSLEDLTLNITQEIHVNAPLHATFEALLEQIGPHNEGAEGTAMPMKIEPWPGGRWYRDLGGDDGHLWGHVQAIKSPTLLEISWPALHVQPGGQQRAVQTQRREGRDNHQIPPLRFRFDSRRPQEGCCQRLGKPSRPDSLAR